MSAALVRQALEFVDPDEKTGNHKKRQKRGANSGRQNTSSGRAGQDSKQVQLSKPPQNNNLQQTSSKKAKKIKQEVITKLLKLSKQTIDKKIAKKIVKRAKTGKPVGDKIKVKKDKQKSILFPDEN